MRRDPNRLPDLALRGDVLLSISYKKWPPFWNPFQWFKKSLLNTAIDEIRGYQWRRYPTFRDTKLRRMLLKTTHARYILTPEKVFDVTFPATKWSTLQEIVDNQEHIILCRSREYPFADWNPYPTIQRLEPYIGKSYDLLDLAAFRLAEPFGVNSLPGALLGELVGIGKDNMVCSQGTRLAAEIWLGIEGIEKPLFQHPIDFTAPATFPCDSKNPWEVVYEWRPNWLFG